jgi:hypothetical protein
VKYYLIELKRLLRAGSNVPSHIRKKSIILLCSCCNPSFPFFLLAMFDTSFSVIGHASHFAGVSLPIQYEGHYQKANSKEIAGLEKTLNFIEIRSHVSSMLQTAIDADADDVRTIHTFKRFSL